MFIKTFPKAYFLCNPLGCDCNTISDCDGVQGENIDCVDCVCQEKFPPGCNCNSIDDCEGNGIDCIDCICQSKFPPGCDCESDSDCVGGETVKCVSCNCKDCPVSTSTGTSGVLNPPLTFVVDTTKSVKPDKYSIFNLTQKVVERIQEIQANIPSYHLVTFNDYGPDMRRNVDYRLDTNDVIEFKQEIISLVFESFDGGRDSRERLMQGLIGALNQAPEKSLIVVFTDNGSKDLNLKRLALQRKREKNITVYIVLTPIFEGFPNDPSLRVYDEVADQVFYINEVGADFFLGSVEAFEETNCI